MSSTTQTLTQAAKDFPAEHGLRHRMREGCRESLAHMVMFPDVGIAGFVYPTRRTRSACTPTATRPTTATTARSSTAAWSSTSWWSTASAFRRAATSSADIDGATGAGWCEFCWNRDDFDFAQQHVQQFG